MSLTGAFSDLSSAPESVAISPKRHKRDAPFAIRLSKDERARLMNEAKGLPLGTYIKAKLLGDAAPLRMRRSGLGIQDRTALAQLVAILGRSRMASNLNQLAHLAHVGALSLTPDIEDELTAALADVRDMRRLLLLALGFKPETRP